MQLNLTRPLLFFDIESTGLNVATDRIVEISAVKVHPGGEKEIKTRRITITRPSIAVLLRQRRFHVSAIWLFFFTETCAFPFVAEALLIISPPPYLYCALIRGSI